LSFLRIVGGGPVSDEQRASDYGLRFAQRLR
jgi:hypothetical protein